MSEYHNDELSEREELQIDRLMDNAGFTAERAHQKIGDAAISFMGNAAVSQAIYYDRAKRHHPSRRGGRSFPEPSDSTLDPDWPTTAEELDEEQQETNRRGIALGNAVVEFASRPDVKALSKDDRQTAIDHFISLYNGDSSIE